MSDELLLFKQCIDDIKEYADEALKEERNDFYDGKRLAYVELLSILKNSLIPLSVEPKEMGLDFDIDRKYL